MSLQRINDYILSVSEQEESIGKNESRALTARTPLVNLATEEANLLVDVDSLQREYRADRQLSVDIMRDYTPNITLGNSISCTVPYTTSTSDRLVLTTQRISASFTMSPFEYPVSTVTEQADFNKKMGAVEAAIAKQVETLLLQRLDTERNTVWNNNNLGLAAQNGGSIDIVNNHILVPFAGRNTFVSTIPSFLNGNDLSGTDARVISSVNMTQNVQYVFNQGEQNAQNLAYQVQQLPFYATTNNITPNIVAGNPAFATGYFFTAGTIGLVNLVDPNFENPKHIGDDLIFYSTEKLPKSGLRFMYKYSKTCADISAATGLPSLTAAIVETYSFMVDIMIVTQYNPDPLKSTSIFKFQMLN